MINESRPLVIRTGGQIIAPESRIRIMGHSSMSLMPDYGEIDIYNLEDADRAKVNNAKIILVAGEGNSAICYGEVEDVYTHISGTTTVTTVCVSDGKTFWDTSVSKTIGSGASVRDSLLSILGSGLLASFLADNPRMLRGQTFTGRLSDCVSMLARSAGARAYFTRGAVHVTAPGRSEQIWELKPDEIISVNRAKGVLMIRTIVKGYAVGTMIRYNGRDYRLIAQTYEADNWNGAWRSELTLLDEAELDAFGMGGG